MFVLAILLALELVGGWTIRKPTVHMSDITVAAGGRRLFAVGIEGNMGRRLYRSDDAGSRWTRLDGSPSILTSIVADPHDPERVFAVSVFASNSGFSTLLDRSVDAGQTWTRVADHFRATSGHVALDPVVPGVLYVSYGEIRKVFRSDDGGNTFAEFEAPFSGALLSVAADGRVVAAAEIPYVSYDRGEHWGPAGNPAFLCPILTLAVDPVDPNRWYVGGGPAFPPCHEAARTEDAGVTWTRLADLGGPVDDLATVASQPGWIYASIGLPEPSQVPGRVLSSPDGGATWFDVGIPPGVEVKAIALPPDGGAIYAATDTGVYRRPLRRTTALPPR